MRTKRTKQAKSHRRSQDQAITVRLPANTVKLLRVWMRTFNMSRSEVLRTWLGYGLAEINAQLA